VVHQDHLRRHDQLGHGVADESNGSIISVLQKKTNTAQGWAERILNPMKIRLKNQFLLPVLLAGLGLMLAGRAPAQTFTVMHTFAVSSGGSFLNDNLTNSDGAVPNAGFVLSGNTLYGTASFGGSKAYGTVFKVNTDGTSFTNLYAFTNGSDGSFPYAGLVLSGNTLYGAADIGHYPTNGTVFALNTNGTGFTILHTFPPGSGSPNYANSDGANPDAGLLLSGNTLYGTTYNGGTNGGGAVFRVNTNGTSFTNLHNFAAISYYPNNTNKGGGRPSSVLVLSGNTLYGTTGMGGTNGNGTVFKVNTDGTGFTNLHIFTAYIHTNSYGQYTNSDGALPQAGLILSGNTLYGVAGQGGSGNSGTVFSLNTNGTGFTTLYSFAQVTMLKVATRTVTDLFRMQICFYRATPCMGRQVVAAVRVVGRCSKSIPMARDLRPCIISRRFLLIIFTVEPTATGHFRRVV
jgi:uncharacterized repeat protein (TIGR03803 family)